jgi:phage-related tail fiber protein
MSVVDRQDIYLDGHGVKAPAYLATTANITLSGLQSIDGVTPVANDRILVKDQTDATENGVYYAASGNWTRAPDFSHTGQVVEGTRVFVTDGTVNGGTEWRITTSGTIVFDTSSITFVANSLVSLILTDGITAPSATVGKAKIYVDTSDGDLKVIFGDGTIKTIVVDT